jgi:chromosomal replication initiator protein
MQTLQNSGTTGAVAPAASGQGSAGQGSVGQGSVGQGSGVQAHSGQVASTEPRGQRTRTLLKARLGEDIFTSWFQALEFDSFDGKVVRASVPVKFLRNWITSHYSDDLLACARAEFKGAERVEVNLRQPGTPAQRNAPAPAALRDSGPAPQSADTRDGGSRPIPVRAIMQPQVGRTSVGGFEGSPLDPRYTFDSFIVGPSNRMAHAGATQVAEMALSDKPNFNPLYIHSSVGLGKTHLLHAIAWEVKRRSPDAQVLYLTAERFRYQFVEAIRSQDAMGFKDKFRSINVLLIDDLEFMRGERTEQEFDHIINSLLDGGRQIVVASARPPNHIESLNERMRSRLQRGLVTEIGRLDQELRCRVLERRLAEKQAADPSFQLAPDVIALLGERLLPHVDGDVQVDRPRPTRQREPQRAPQVLRQALRRGHHRRVLGDRAEHLHDVDVLPRRLLRRALAERVRRRLPGDDEDRHAVGERARDAGDEVRGAGARRRGADREAAAGAGVAVGHEGSAALVLRVDELELLVVLHRLEHGVEEPADDAEDVTDTLRLEIPQEDVDGAGRGRGFVVSSLVVIGEPGREAYCCTHPPGLRMRTTSRNIFPLSLSSFRIGTTLSKGLTGRKSQKVVP